ncbi:MAG: hypothetical protein M3065_10345 [Actinomycetota bacterium]|nr:hypothetical protein [Actinomycetota bacterium]
MPGPEYLDTGFADFYAFQSLTAMASAKWFSRAQSLGSSWVRLDAVWSAIAPSKLTRGFKPANPSDPRYDWSALDAAVRDATAHRQHVLLILVGAPVWALGRHPPPTAFPGTWRPSPSALGAFAHASAERYSGHFADPLNVGQSLPQVTYFQAWNEPNLRNYLAPQWTRDAAGKWVPASPYWYRRMLNAVYANLKTARPDAFVLAAGTAPYGDPPGVDRMAPVVFLRSLLCLNGSRLKPAYCPDPAHFDALDHHPYSLTPTIHAYSADDVGVADIGRLQTVLTVAEHTGRALPAGPKSIWVTEIAWSSNPPDPLAIPEARQARYLALAFYELWRQGVGHVFWLLIRDFPYKSLTGSGLYVMDGTPKRSSRAFRFPFIAVPGRHHELTLWGRAPQGGPVVIERGDGHGWTPVIRLSANRGGIFYATGRLGSYPVLRAVIGDIASPPWTSGG